MTCSITIQKIEGSLPGPAIIVTGTAQDCSEINVKLDCGSFFLFNENTPVQNGNWCVSFTEGVSNICNCGGMVKVQASCVTDETCVAELETSLECTDCIITIDKVEGALPGPTITIEGTAIGCACEEIKVVLQCQGPRLPEKSIKIINNKWSVKFKNIDFSYGCNCDSGVLVKAFCTTNPNCVAEFAGDLICKDPNCPTIANLNVTVGECDPISGKVKVNVSAIVSPGSISPPMVQWLHDLNNGFASPVLNPNQVVSDVYDYPGDGKIHKATLKILYPAGCLSEQVSFQVPDCKATTDCPTIKSTSFKQSNCTENGNRNVTFTVELDSPSPYSAKLLDGNAQTVATIQGSGYKVLSHTSSIPGGQTVKYTLERTNCESLPFSFSVSSCDCPPVPFIKSPWIGECDSNGYREVIIQAEVNWNKPYTAELRDSNNNTLDQKSGPGSQTLIHKGKYLGGTKLTFEVVFVSPADCSGAKWDVNIKDCPIPPKNGNDGDNDDDDEGMLCGGLRFLTLLSAVLALVLAPIATCVPTAAGVLAFGAVLSGIVALLAGIAYYLFCPNKPCAVGLLTSAQVTLAAGLVLASLSGCCGFGWVVLLYFATGLSLLLTWKAQCNKGWCNVAKKMATSLEIALILVAGLSQIPAISTCLNLDVAIIANGLFALVTIGVTLSCKPTDY